LNATETTIGFIGAGNMAQAIIRGLLQAGHPPNRIAVADPGKETLHTITALDSDIFVSSDNYVVAERSDVVVLATKPNTIEQVAAEIASAQPKLVISVAAGIKLASIEKALAPATAVVRNMPNQPALLGLGMSGLVGNAAVDSADHELAAYIAAATGELVWLDDESLMDAITAISGSGPAYFYLLLEMLEAGAIAYGFTPDVARKLAVQTGLGATTLALQDPATLAELRRRVTSPGGTTEAAIKSLESDSLRTIFQQALDAARQKSIELGNK
jgi:pyrroline-5-carboxylate reductase